MFVSVWLVKTCCIFFLSSSGRRFEGSGWLSRKYEFMKNLLFRTPSLQLKVDSVDYVRFDYVRECFACENLLVFFHISSSGRHYEVSG